MKREKWIDSLKGIACVVVFLNHFWLTFGYTCIGLNEIIMVRPFNILVNGNYAVCLFLIISAYVIGKPIYLKKDFRKVQRTLLKRYPRLVLPVLFSSFFSYVLYHTIGFYNKQVGKLLENDWLMKKYSTPLTIQKLISTSFIKVWCNGDASFNAPFWMLQILFLGTFLTVLLAVMTAGRKLGYVIFLSLIGVYIYLQSLYLCFILGTLLAYISSQKDERECQRNNCHVAIYIILLVGGIYIPGYSKEIISYIDLIIPNESYICDATFYNIMGSFLLIVSFMGIEKMKKCLECSKILNRLQKVSFSIYLVHWPIICSFSCFLYMTLQSTSYEKCVINTIVFLSTGIVIAIVCKIFYVLVERKICDKVVQSICEIYFEEET